MEKGYNSDVIAALHGNKPYARYMKTILGKVAVDIMNELSGEPQIVLLAGEPVDSNDSAIICTWDLAQDLYFKRQNKRHLEDGTIIPARNMRKENPVATIEQAEDGELRELVNKPHFAVMNIVNNTKSEALLFRLLRIAQEEEKSEKTMNLIRNKLAELQNQTVIQSEIKMEK